jgi:hypothetical protein
LIESGNNIYAIRLSENLNCQFGYGTSPITLFSPGFSGEFIKSCELRNNENDSVIDFRRESKLSLDGFNWLIFAIDRASVIKTLEAAAKLAKQQGSHSHKHDSDRDRSEEVTDRFAIPFYFNLYQKPVGIPIWVLNDHEHSPMATNPIMFHGGAHPNSNGFLMLE